VITVASGDVVVRNSLDDSVLLACRAVYPDQLLADRQQVGLHV